VRYASFRFYVCSYKRSNLVKRFVTKELMRWSGIQEFFGPILANTDVFSGENGKKRYEDLHTRVTEHVSHHSQYLRRKKLMVIVEHSRHLRILLANIHQTTHRSPRVGRRQDGRNLESARRFRNGMGTDRQTGRSNQLPSEEGR
jgi:hypothetical protein